LLAAGYRLSGKNSRTAKHRLFIDYSRSEELFTLSWDWHHKTITAELLAAGGAELKVIATAELAGVRSTSDIDARLAPFRAALGNFVNGLRKQGPEPETRSG
jgi:hypothetical protein